MSWSLLLKPTKSSNQDSKLPDNYVIEIIQNYAFTRDFVPQKTLIKNENATPSTVSEINSVLVTEMKTDIFPEQLSMTVDNRFWKRNRKTDTDKRTAAERNFENWIYSSKSHNKPTYNFAQYYYKVINTKNTKELHQNLDTAIKLKNLISY